MISMSNKKASNDEQNCGLNLCNRCRHGIFSMWGSYTDYDSYMCCPYSSHSHYPRKECVFYEKGNVPFCPQHKCDMKFHGTHEDITIYRCAYGTREVWVHENGLKRQVERKLDLKSRTAKGVIRDGFDIVESTKIEIWE